MRLNVSLKDVTAVKFVHSAAPMANVPITSHATASGVMSAERTADGASPRPARLHDQSPKDTPSVTSLLVSAPTAASAHRSVFLHIPERRSAPRRSLDISKVHPTNDDIRQTSQAHSNISDAARLKNAPTFSANDISQRPHPVHRHTTPHPNASSQPTTTFLYGLDGFEDENHTAQDQSPTELPDRVKSSNGICASSAASISLKTSTVGALKQRASTPTSNPISPPSCRSPLISVQMAAAISGLGLHDADVKDGQRSVEASTYVLGEREASYIARRLKEEQRRRVAREQEDGEHERRGRSRDRKRALSWSFNRLMQATENN
ncbi:hypothetical protein EMMF5_003050 [Cystobasidiomycetes sp. EMM_F5]